MYRVQLKSLPCLFYVSLLASTMCLAIPSNRIPAVRIVTARYTHQPKIITSIGHIQGVGSTYVQSLVPGQVESIFVSEGSSVKKGQLLAVLNSDKEKLAIVVAKADVRKSEAVLSNQKKIVERVKILTKNKSTTLSLLEEEKTQLKMLNSAYLSAQSQLKNAKFNLAHTQIKATVSGAIQEKKITVGSVINEGMPIFMISSSGLLKAILPFAQDKYPFLKVGQPVVLSNIARAGSKLHVTISKIKPLINPITHSFDVLCFFKNKLHWKSGSSVKADITVNAHRHVILIPQMSIMYDSPDLYVFIVREGKAEKKHIKVVGYLKHFAEVIKGLQPGDHVITEGAVFLHNQDPVRVVD